MRQLNSYVSHSAIFRIAPFVALLVMGPRAFADDRQIVPIYDSIVEWLTKSGTQDVDVTGTWQAQVEVSGQTGEPVFTFVQDGDKVTGRYQGAFGERKVTGKLKRDQIEFEFSIELGDVVYTGTVEKDTIKGTAQYGEFSGTWTAKRKADKK